jgi:hypothetical protein
MQKANDKPNIIWVVTDSARNFSTGGLDDRDRPKFFDEIAGDFVNFENTVTSAPSSVMSGSCMLTGMNSYYIGRNYDDFRYEEGAFPNLASILRKDGYETQGIFVAREMREKIAPFIGHVEKKHWPKKLSHSQRMWTNEDANKILDNFLSRREENKPLFLMLWNNIRHDYNISTNLENLVTTLKDKNYYDNSIIIFCADHGYPHPRRGFTPEYLKREGLTHDLMLGDDNILIPLLIKTPDSVPRNVKEQVGTIDLFPTIIDYLEIQSYEGMNSYPQNGVSLRALIKNNENSEFFNKRSIRCDCRFFGQSQRKTAIRQGQYKYVYSHDDNLEEFYDVIYDPSEDESLLSMEKYQDKINELRAIFKKEESLANDFQEKYITKKFVKTLSAYKLSKNLIIFSLQESQINDRIISALNDTEEFSIKFFLGKSSNNIEIPYSYKNLNELDDEDLRKLKSLISSGSDSCLLYTEKDSNFKSLIEHLEENNIKIKKEFDINFQSNADIQWVFSRAFRALLSRRKLIISEPTLLITYIKEYIIRFLKKFR